MYSKAQRLCWMGLSKIHVGASVNVHSRKITNRYSSSCLATLPLFSVHYLLWIWPKTGFLKIQVGNSDDVHFWKSPIDRVHYALQFCNLNFFDIYRRSAVRTFNYILITLTYLSKKFWDGTNTPQSHTNPLPKFQRDRNDSFWVYK